MIDWTKTADACGLVLDMGSKFTKFGFGGDDFPRAFFPTVIARPTYADLMVGMGHQSAYVGDWGMSKPGTILTYPVQRGNVPSWEDYQTLLHSTLYNELKIAPEEHPLLFLEPVWTSPFYRERLTEMFLEEYSVAAFSICSQVISPFYQHNVTTGIVLDIGGGLTQVAALYDGHLISGTLSRMSLGGCDLDRHMMTFHTTGDFALTSTWGEATAAELKIAGCYVAENYAEELKSGGYDEISVETKQHSGIWNLKKERIEVPEILFDPSIIDSTLPGVHKFFCDILHKIDDDAVRDAVLQNVIVVGGTSMLQGFEARFIAEVQKIFPSARFNFSPERKFAAWQGGSKLVELIQFYETWMVKEDYDEYGPGLSQKQRFY